MKILQKRSQSCDLIEKIKFNTVVGPCEKRYRAVIT